MCKDKTVVKVGIADLKIVTPPDVIRTSGLGSCVGVVIYDSIKKVAGLAHVLLPDSKSTKQENFNRHKYADTAVSILINELLVNGGRRFALKAKLAGGAQMFQFTSSSDSIRIGARNIEAVRNQLNEFHIPIVSSDVGGNVGRTIEFDPITCQLKVRKINQEEIYI
ncbi:chemotaxis protein CheD [Oceanobacillus halophilus]|uniref:Probable chemoreceptor glutamine deamidase CheD n=1 Tax=Oceanobacillus halophilus TaxID=930130 RepID=A0A495AFB3_9BACI|nr:chemotaxis protein CheD [Oceanobacillus halophilus]RKQ37505.1 chemotaxis protein CheD [Oceanobacillus halophilus]